MIRFWRARCSIARAISTSRTFRSGGSSARRSAGRWSLVAEYDGEPNGMKFVGRSTLLITDYKNGLVQLRIATGEVTPFLERRNSERFGA